MADTIFGSGSQQWVCPNDRQLALRAKLQTGWSVHTYQTEKQRKSQSLSPAEVEAILQVIQRAERLDVLEQQRIGRLVERLDTMRRNVMGNGLSQCLLCGEVLGYLGSSSVFCKDCRKWFPATATATRTSAPPAWRTDSRPLGSGTRKAADPGGTQVAAWSPPRWSSPTHPATCQGARAAWPARPGPALQTHRGAPHPGRTQRAPAKGTPGRVPAADWPNEPSACPGQRPAGRTGRLSSWKSERARTHSWSQTCRLLPDQPRRPHILPCPA
ncbi:PREDICTED: rab effector Noc2 isoform X4 [Myotis brandtii]|uniref:rab effector Noc2 isoform X4 n=1 Tax=Myotis brandtii TaxID=109478 RepID=UPI0007041DD1|nr:PREDICTED: rab effector Noc2 isoform X4 [Myotis brandtii]